MTLSRTEDPTRRFPMPRLARLVSSIPGALTSAVAAAPPAADETVERTKRSWLSAGSVRRRWVVAVFVASAVFAGATAVFTTQTLHRVWGVAAVCAYGLAAVAALLWKSRGVDLALIIAISGAIAGPLMWLAASGQGQPEVIVIERSAGLLVRHGNPYQSQAQIAPTGDPNSYNPYLPALTLFGLPHALGWPGLSSDPRLWFGLAFAAMLVFALLRARAPDPWRWTALIIATPAIALPIAVGGTDLPVLALMCLGLAFLRAKPQPVAAGLALGAASAMKATAWPALLIGAALLAAGGGWRPAVKFAGTALAVCTAVIAPFAALWPRELVQNTIMFPLGLTRIKSQAASPLLGHLLAETGSAGHIAAVALLATAGLAVAVSLVLRPLKDARAAALRLALGLALMFTLAPATRFGYFSYPAALLVWLWLAGPEHAQQPKETRPNRGRLATVT
ncbi:MAG: glycosyltransferase 87 family protein [Micromonosporaceae bacterium]